MEKTQKIIKTGAEMEVEIEEKPIKNTCEKKIQKKLLRLLNAGQARERFGSPGHPLSKTSCGVGYMK